MIEGCQTYKQRSSAVHLVKYLVFLFIIVMFNINFVIAKEKETHLFDWSDAYLYNFYSIDPLSSGDIWIVGSNGLIIHHEPKTDNWVVQEANTTENLYQVEFANPNKGWIVSTDGRILRTEDGGKSWKIQETPTEQHLFSISCLNATTAWAVGCYGTILHTKDAGKTWQRQGEKIDRIYNKVHFVDEQYGWIAGEYGVILHTTDGGHTWKEQKHELGEVTLFSVYFKNRSKGWVVGMGGRMLMTNNGGKKWQEIKTSVKTHLFDLEIEKDKGYCVGFQGSYLESSSKGWLNLAARIPNQSWLKDVVFLNKNKGWIVGSCGAALYTADGGLSWEPIAR